MDLFADDTALTPIPMDDGELWFQQRLALDLAPDEVMRRLADETDWRHEEIQVWGKLYKQPRLSAWHGEASYRYSGKTFHPLPFTALQLHIKQAVERATGREFNSVLLNYYRDQRDSMGFHADDERELGPEPAIASVASALVLDEIARREHLTVAPEEVDKEIERFAEQAGRTPAALRAQLEKEGGVSRLTVGLRREKAVDMAMSRATITESRRDADSVTSS